MVMNHDNSALSSLAASLRLIGVCCLLFGAAYPLAVLGAGKLIAPAAAEGSLIRDENGKVVGSELLAQGFTKPEWFWARPSAVGYNASATGGSNLAPTNPALAKRINETIASHRAAGDDVTPARPLPLDLALASGGGLDPDITLEAARFQAPRVARARQLPLDRVNGLIEAHASGDLSQAFTGSARTVNVVRLNYALARLRAGATVSAAEPLRTRDRGGAGL
jgi:K+-transporting ATPase ATPase C chain